MLSKHGYNKKSVRFCLFIHLISKHEWDSERESARVYHHWSPKKYVFQGLVHTIIPFGISFSCLVSLISIQLVHVQDKRRCRVGCIYSATADRLTRSKSVLLRQISKQTLVPSAGSAAATPMAAASLGRQSKLVVALMIPHETCSDAVGHWVISATLLQIKMLFENYCRCFHSRSPDRAYLCKTANIF